MVDSIADRNNLILAAQTGDPVAIGRLLAVCQADARRYAHKHCQSSDVDDAVQESLLIIARKVSGLKAAAAFSGWLFTVIKRECRKLDGFGTTSAIIWEIPKTWCCLSGSAPSTPSAPS